MKVKWHFLYLGLIICNDIQAQSTLKTMSDPYSFQYGVSFKAILEFGFTRGSAAPNCRFSGNFGVGSNFISSWIYPTVNIEVDLYNGGMGSRAEKNFFHSFNDLDIIAGLTATAGTRNHLTDERIGTLKNRNIPLYYFADFVYPALQNPFDFSMSVGTDIVFTPLNPEKANQRLGFINAHFDRIQISYYNDGGTPVSNIYLGDKKDRGYTGGAVLSYHGHPNSSVSLLEISYQKFTGYTKNAFEISNNLFLNYMNYHDPIQRKYNKSLWSVNLGNPSRGWNLKLSNYNSISLDMQHYIHWGLFNTYHMVPYKPYWSLSGGYLFTTAKLGIR